MSTYVTENGFEKRRQDQIKTDLENAFKTIYGQDVQLAPESTNGQHIGTLSEALADIWDGLEIVYNSFLPGSVTGRNQEELYRLNGLERGTASPSTAELTISGSPGYIVVAGFKASTESGLTFETTDDVTIEPGGTVVADSECTITGPNLAPAGTIIKIVTPQGLVTGVDNLSDAIPGKNEESSALFRLRRTLSTGAPGANLLESAFGQIANLDGVTDVRIYQNRTKFDDPTKPGLLANSWMPVVLGGDPDEIALTIWRNTSAGIASVGNTEIEIKDLFDFPQIIKYEIPVLLNIYVKVTITTDLEFPADGEEEIKDNIINYARGELLGETGFAGFGIGEDVLIARLYTPINRVQGHNVNSVEISDVDPGSVAPSDIAVAFNNLSLWDKANIVVVIS